MSFDLGTDNVLWDLSHLYKNIDDPAIISDLKECEEKARKFAQEYKGKLAELNPSELFNCVSELEAISSKLSKIGAFAQLNFSTKVNDPKAGSFLQKTKEMTSAISRELVFFDLEWVNVPNERADTLLKDPSISHYRHYLSSLRRYRSHFLSETEERLIVELSPVGPSSWINLFEKVFAFKRYGKEGRTQEEVLTDLYSPERIKRKNAADELTEGLKDGLHIVSHIFNTLLADKMIMDRLRHYDSWISSMNLANELDENTVNALISASTSNYDTVRRYYRMKKALLGHERLYDYDRYAPLPFAAKKTISWKDGRDMVLSSFKKFSSKMEDIALLFFENSWIHAPVMKGKTSGAFAHPAVPEVHPYILVNYTGNLRDVETVAHELGHGVHQYLSAQKGLFNSHTPLTLAETASVFAEILVFKELLSRLDDKKEKLALLCSKIESIFATVFRQTAMNRFEDAIHNMRREKGELSPDDFSILWLKTQEEMFGESVELTENYGFWWSYIGHFIHVPGYVYSYAFGELLVLSLYSMYESGALDFDRKYLELLAAGGSDTPYALLEPFGIDLKSPGFWEKGLSLIDKMVTDAESMAEDIIT